MALRTVDEHDWGFGWIGAENERFQMAGHALLADGRVWLVDPPEPEEVEGRIRALGAPGGVIQLLDRHHRASAALAERLGVPLWVVPVAPVAEAPFEFVPLVRRRWWVESALWWPERRVLVCGDALGTVPHYFRLGRDRIGVHPLLRLTPPRALARLEPEHVLVGHGEGVHEGATQAVRDALRTSRRRLPRLALELPVGLRK